MVANQQLPSVFYFRSSNGQQQRELDARTGDSRSTYIIIHCSKNNVTGETYFSESRQTRDDSCIDAGFTEGLGLASAISVAIK